MGTVFSRTKLRRWKTFDYKNDAHTLKKIRKLSKRIRKPSDYLTASVASLLEQLEAAPLSQVYDPEDDRMPGEPKIKVQWTVFFRTNCCLYIESNQPLDLLKNVAMEDFYNDVVKMKPAHPEMSSLFFRKLFLGPDKIWIQTINPGF